MLISASVTNGVKTLVLSTISLGIAFDKIDWTQTQIAAVLGVVASGFVALSAVAAALTRRRVTPVDR